MTNRLAHETSPYLRQHADNPVDWFPWGDEAFREARERDVPVLLSVGYSACHWCHVMAHESFEDPETSELMNKLFVNVKVDREERPDVDALYMQVLQATSGNGGWPMTVLLDHDQRPIWAGTYFPRHRRGSMPSFTEVCTELAELWSHKRADLAENSLALTEALSAQEKFLPGDTTPGMEQLSSVARALVAEIDPEYGGFGSASKFPRPSSVDALLIAAALGRLPESDLAPVLLTLDAMAAGGIRDHLGGGFARYSVDRKWLVPHFEKMLYDQSQLVRLFLHAWQLTGIDYYRTVMQETIEFVIRDLRQPAGGFSSSVDADSEGREGLYYLWTPAEVHRAVGDPALAEHAIQWWGVTEGGNFEGASILHRPLGTRAELSAELDHARHLMLEHRRHRKHPDVDDKVLAEWNAMFTSSLAEAAMALGRDDWAQVAVENGRFLATEMRDEAGRWQRSWHRTSGAQHAAVAADVASAVEAFTRLYELTGELHWLRDAEHSARTLLDDYGGSESGALFSTSARAPKLITRGIDLVDNALPSANSTAATALVRLGMLSGDGRWTDSATRISRAIWTFGAAHPGAVAGMVAAIPMLDGGGLQIVIPGDGPALREVAFARWRPQAVIAWGEGDAHPLFEGRSEGFAYVCRGSVCGLPASTPAELTRQLADSGGRAD